MAFIHIKHISHTDIIGLFKVGYVYAIIVMTIGL